MLALRPRSTTTQYSNKKQSVSNKLNKLQINLKSSKLNLTKKIYLILLQSLSVQIVESGTPTAKISVVVKKKDKN